MGVLTDGKDWLLRWPRAGEVRSGPVGLLRLPPWMTMNGWFHLYEWLRDTALVFLEGIHSDTDSIRLALSPLTAPPTSATSRP